MPSPAQPRTARRARRQRVLTVVMAAIGTVALSAFAQRYGITRTTPIDLLLFAAVSLMVVVSVVWNEATLLAAAGLVLVASFGVQSIRSRGRLHSPTG